MSKPSVKDLKNDLRLQNILQVVERQVLAGGFDNINLSQLIIETNISRGTLYSLTPNKDTVIVYLAMRGLDDLIKLYEAAKDFDGSARDKAICMLYSNEILKNVSPISFKAIVLALEEIKDIQISEEITAKLNNRLDRLITMISSMMEASIKNGDLSKRNGLGMYSFASQVWSACLGLSWTSSRKNVHYFHEAGMGYIYFVNMIFNGIGWKPVPVKGNENELNEKIVSYMTMKLVYPDFKD